MVDICTQMCVLCSFTRRGRMRALDTAPRSNPKQRPSALGVKTGLLPQGEKAMDRFIVSIRVSKSGTPDTFMAGKRTVTSTSIASVLHRLTDELEKMDPTEEDPNA